VAPNDALRGFLSAFAVPDERIPADLDARAALYRSQLANKRVLVILDNATDAEQVRPLLPGSSTCLVLVTSRAQFTSLVATQGSHRLSLDLLSEADARQLLAAHLGDEPLRSDPPGTAELIGLCARLPLALTVAAARAATNPGFPLAVLNAELRDVRSRLDALDAGDSGTDVRAVFSWSYNRLDSAAASMFRMLGLHPGPDISAPAAASLAGLPLVQASRILLELARTHMVSQHAPGRFLLHDLLRLYATELGQVCDSESMRRAASIRALDYYLYAANAAALALDPARQSPALPAIPPGVLAEGITTIAQALAWLQAERDVVLAAIATAADMGLPHALRLPWELAPFFDRRGDWHDYAATQHVALAAASRLDDRGGQARAYRHLGRAHFAVGAYEDAQAHLLHALHLYEELGVEPAQAGVHLDLVRVSERRHANHRALAHAQQALSMYRATGYQPGQASALNSIGWCYALIGEAHQALTFCGEALHLHRRLGNRYGVAITWESLGYAYQQLGRYSEAVGCYKSAIELFHEFDDRYNEATVLAHLGDTSHVSGDATAARGAWRQALSILGELNHPDAQDVRGKLLRSHAEQGQPLLGS
jgi:tetratricopeptide (TPR) repeat protein